ncbi:sodium:solute symporter [Candidatus Omnitrophota bacterium]
MNLSRLDLSALLIYFAIVLIIGFISSRRQTKEGFLIAERKLNYWNLIASICASFLGGGALVAFTAYVYQFGLSAMWFFIGISAGILLFLTFYKKLKALSDQKKFYTLSDYFYLKYGKGVGLLSAIIIFICAFCFILMQFIAGGSLLAAISGLSYPISVSIMGIVVFVYLILGGFRAVVKTDIFQYSIIFLLGAIIILPLQRNLQLLPEQIKLTNLGLTQSIAWLLIGAFTIVPSADLWQRIYAAKDTRQAKIGIIGSAVSIILLGLIVSIIGLAAKTNFTQILPDQALVYGISKLLPTGFLGLGLVMLFAVIMSTLDTALFVISMNVSQDVVSHYRELSKAVLVKITRYSIFILAFTGMLLAIFVQNIITVSLTLAGIGLNLVPTILASFWLDLKTHAVFMSILAGLTSIAIVLAAGIIGPETTVASLPISAIFLWIGQKTFKS